MKRTTCIEMRPSASNPTTLTHATTPWPHLPRIRTGSLRVDSSTIMVSKPTPGGRGLDLALLLGTGVALGASLAANWSLLRREERRQRQQGKHGNEGVGGEGFEICKCVVIVRRNVNGILRGLTLPSCPDRTHTHTHNIYIYMCMFVYA